MPVDRIVDAAVRIADERGAEALSLRAVAQRLGSSTATLYRHLDSRAELIQLALDRVLGEVDVDETALADAEWDEACRMLAQAMFDTLSRHRGLDPALGGNTFGPEHDGPSRAEHLRAHRSRLPVDVTPLFSVTLARYVLGFAMQRRADHRDATQPAAGAIDAKKYPGLAAAAEFWPTPLQDECEYGLRFLLVGLTHDL